MTQPCIVVVMGVSGSGKSTVGALLAARLACVFQEGDALHSAANIAKMHAGILLTDADRVPWLQAIEQWIDHQLQCGQSGVISCSALKRAYRDQLRHARPRLQLLYLQASTVLIEQRLRQRSGHFMPASLLSSQFAALESPDQEAQVDVVEVDGYSPEQIVQQALTCIGAANHRPEVER